MNCRLRNLVICSLQWCKHFICFMSKGKDRSGIHSDVKIGLAMSLSRSRQRRQLSSTGQLTARQTISDFYWKRNERLLLGNNVCQMVMMLLHGLHLERYSRLCCRWKPIEIIDTIIFLFKRYLIIISTESDYVSSTLWKYSEYFESRLRLYKNNV